MGTLFVGVADENSSAHHIVLSGQPDDIRVSAAELALCTCVAGPVSMWIASRLAAVAPG